MRISGQPGINRKSLSQKEGRKERQRRGRREREESKEERKEELAIGKGNKRDSRVAATQDS